MEPPLHLSDLTTRVASMWGSRAGTRIKARVAEICQAAEREKLLIQRAGFELHPDERCTVRSRAGMRIPAERIAPEEYREAVLCVLRTGHGFNRSELINEVRTVLGFSQTRGQLEAAIGGAIDQLLTGGVVGEGSAGITLRR